MTKKVSRKGTILPQAVAKFGFHELLQQLVPQIPWGRLLHLLNNKPVGISGYVTRMTESLPKKLKGLLPSPEELEAELSKTAGGNSEG